MRLHPNSALVVCLCLWIPVALTYGAVAPEDQDGSGDDDEFSGSGSGDDDIWIVNPERTTQPSLNTTTIVSFKDGPFIQLEHTVTPVVHLDPEPETSGHTTEVPVPSTTQITETQPSTVSIKSFGSKEDHKEETTTIRDVAHPETTLPPVEKLPIVPTDQEVQTTSAHVEENITESSVETRVLVEVVSLKTEAPDSETTTVFLSTTSASKIHDSEASGDAVESTTVQGIDDNLIERAIIPVERAPNEKTMMDSDFVFDQTQETGKSNFARGNTDNDSILEKKEVLAGVIAGGIVGLAFAIMLVALMVYRMKKKDEGSYSLDEHKHPNGGYQKPQKQEEFLA